LKTIIEKGRPRGKGKGGKKEVCCLQNKERGSRKRKVKKKKKKEKNRKYRVVVNDYRKNRKKSNSLV